MADIVRYIQNISEEHAVNDFLKLKNSVDIRYSALVGQKVMKYFFTEFMLGTKVKTGISFLESLERPELFQKPYMQNVIIHNLKKGKNEILAKYYAFQIYHGGVCAFRPNIARLLYSKYNAQSVLDPCAGFGGRCLGAMSLGINYVGYDTNTSLAPAYNAMLTVFPHNGKIELHFEDSARADFSRHNYDFILTSPPYVKKNRFIETYSEMPQTPADFRESFLKPMILNAWANLKPGGHMALNVCKEMYPWIVEYMGECTEEIPLYIRQRTKGSKTGKNYGESIYVWAKSETFSEI